MIETCRIELSSRTGVFMKLTRALVCEFLGTALLLATVVGSGILSHKLDMGNVALTVFMVSIATAGTLTAGILSLGHISAHFNPIVTLASALRKELPWSNVTPYWLVQVAGAIAGVALANLMFELPAISISETARSGAGQYLGEFIATFGLLGVIFGCARSNPSMIPFAVPFYVAGAIMFTSSTCFANPAVTIARALTGTITGISPDCVVAFIVSQIAACLAAVGLFGWLFKPETVVQEQFSSKESRTERQLVSSALR